MIGIYCHHTRSFTRNTGIQRCLRSIARALAAQGETIVPLVWNQEDNNLDIADQSICKDLAKWNGPSVLSWSFENLPRGSILLVIELISGPYQPSQSFLRQKCDELGWKLIGIFHDSIPLTWGGLSAEYHTYYMKGLANYDLVFTTTSINTEELKSFWNKHSLRVKAKIISLPLAAEISGLKRVKSDCRSTDKEFFKEFRLICVGSLEPRKNHITLLKSLLWLSAIKKNKYHLTLIGWPNNSKVVDQVLLAKSLGLSIIWDSRATDSDLCRYFGSSHLSIYPSLQEGFGLPILESLWLGCPCLTSTSLANNQQLSYEGCLITDTKHWYNLAQTLASLHEDPKVLRKLVNQINSRSLRTWNEYIIEMLNIINKFIFNY